MKGAFLNQWAGYADFSSAVGRLLQRTAPTSSSDQAPVSPAPFPVSFLSEQLPQILGHDLLAVSVEGDQLRVRTTQGEQLVSGSLDRALEEDLRQRHGIQIHRSHWVSLSPMPELLKMSGQWYCVVEDGTRYPISTRRRAEVRQRLGFQRNVSARQ